MAETRWAGYGSNWPEGHRLCKKCGEIKSTEHFHKHAKCKGGYNSVYKDCRVPLGQKQYLTHTTQYKLWYRAKRRAYEKGREFSLALEDVVVPEVCPVFGTPFEDNTIYAASLDRRNSDLGYVKGNVQVISNRANILKNNATLEELEALVKFLQNGVCEIL